MPTLIDNRDSGCAYSTVRNDSGVSKIFGFLPPHGRRLAAGEEFTTFGNILEALGSDIDRGGNMQARVAFEKALQRGDLTIIRTPNPILESDDGNSQMLKLNNDGSLVAATPCWQTGFSDSDGDVTFDKS